MSFFSKITIHVILIAVLFSTPLLFACEVPVFSYAMQYWTADPYRVYIFHAGELSEMDVRLVEEFRVVAAHDTLETNITVEVFDRDGSADAGMLELYRTHLNNIPLAALVMFPASSRITRPLYAGPLIDALIGELVDSPVRRAVAGDLVAGNVAVWVLLESGNRREDNAAAEMLEKELRRMEQVMQLPSIELWAWSDTLRDNAEDGKGIRFSVIRVARDAPEEALFVQMLLNSEPDLPEIDDAPIVFPIFGRGLILYALVGAGINEWTIGEACDFIVGPCSCEAKASNPGTDLLLGVNWSQHLRTTRYDQVAPLAGFSDFFERGDAMAAKLAAESDSEAPVPDATLAVPPIPEEAAESRQPGRMLAFAIALCALTGIFLFSSYKMMLHKEMK